LDKANNLLLRRRSLYPLSYGALVVTFALLEHTSENLSRMGNRSSAILILEKKEVQ
jgi:hypothetical protein